VTSNPSKFGAAARGLLASRWGNAALVAMIILGGYVLPRVVALRGVEMTNQLLFLDMPAHLTNATLLERSSGVEAGGDPYLSRFGEVLSLDFSARWPTGVYELAAPLVRTFGPLSIWTTQLINLLFTVILVLALVGLGSSLGHPRVGIWGAMLAVLCPALAAHTWYFSLDYPLIAMVTMGLYLLWRTRGFSRLPDSVSLGAWSALGLWFKYTYALYLLVPSLVVLALGLWRGPRRARVLLHLAVSVGIAGGLTLALARPDVGALWRELTMHATTTTTEGFTGKLLAPWTVSWLTSVLWLAAASFPLPLLVLALPGIALAHRARYRSLAAPALAFLWGNAALLTLMANKLERYVQPLYPLVCLLTAWGCWRLLPRRWRTAGLAAVAMAHVAVLVATVSHPLPWFQDSEATRDVRYMWELRTPSRGALAQLRQTTFHPACDLRPLARQVAALVRQSKPDRPLGVGALWKRPALPEALEPRELTYFAYLAAAQADRKRLLIPVVDLEQHLPERVLQMPQLILLHHAPRGQADALSGLRVVASRRLMLSCGTESEELQLTLARGRAP